MGSLLKKSKIKYNLSKMSKKNEKMELYVISFLLILKKLEAISLCKI